MPVTITVDDQQLNLEPSSLGDLKSDANLLFTAVPQLKAFLDTPLSLLPELGETAVGYSGSGSWDLPGSGITLGLDGSANAHIAILRSGTLFTWTDGIDDPKDVPVPIPAGHVYVRLRLSATLKVSGSGSFSGGSYGVKVGASSGNTYEIAYCKQFAPTTSLCDAIKQTFAGFTFPFTPDTLKKLGDGDYLQHDFDGRLAFNVGAYIGVDRTLYAGQAAADLLKVSGSDALAHVSCSVQPTVAADASFDFKLEYERRYQVVLGRVGRAGKLHLLTSDVLSNDTTVGATLQISLNAQAGATTGDVKDLVQNHLPAFAASLKKAVSAGGASAQTAINALLQKGSDELSSYAAEITDKLNAWLKKGDNKKAQLQIALENTHRKVLLAGYTVDLDSAHYAEAWQAAIHGDLIAALATGAVTLDAGSGLEREYRHKTSCTCNFFNVWQAQSWTEWQQKVQLVYAGDNVFHLTVEAGRDSGTINGKRSSEIDVYFTAGANVIATGGLKQTDMQLEVVLKSLGNKKAAAQIATVLASLGAGQAPASAAAGSGRSLALVARDLGVFSSQTNQGAMQVRITVPAARWNALQADAKAGANDEHNWSYFVTAAKALNTWLPPYQEAYGTYPMWEKFNLADSGATQPDRNAFGAGGNWPADWDGVPSGLERTSVENYLYGGQHYLNFVAALVQLAALQGSDLAGSWQSFVDQIVQAGKKIPGNLFIRASVLALVRECIMQSFTVAAPATDLLPADHFAVHIVL